VPPRRAAPERPIPPSLEEALLRALAKRPHDRFQSAEAFDAALENCKAEIEACMRGSLRWSLPPGRRWLASGRLRSRWTRAAAAIAAVAAMGLAWTASRGAAPRRAPVQESARASAERGDLGPWVADATPADREAPLRPVMLHSQPEGASVWQDDLLLGLTPLAVVVPNDQALRVMLRKEGFESAAVSLEPERPVRRVQLMAKRRAPAAKRPRPSDSAQTRREAARRGSNLASPYERFD
jgi:hypothetical protein